VSETKPGGAPHRPLTALEASTAGTSAFSPAVRERRARQLLSQATALACVVLLVLATVAPTFYEPALPYAINEPAERDLVAPIALEIEDADARQKLVKAAAAEAPAYYVLDRAGNRRAEDLVRLLVKASEVSRDEKLLPDPAFKQRVARLREWAKAELSAGFTDAALKLALDNGGSDAFRSDAKSLLVHLLDERGILPFEAREDLNSLVSEAKAYLLTKAEQPLDTAELIDAERSTDFLQSGGGESAARWIIEREYKSYENRKQAFAELLSPFLSVNVSRDRDREDIARERLKRQVEAPTRVWRPGDVIAHRGDMVNEAREGQTLKEFNERILRMNWLRIAFFMGLIVSMMAFIAFYASKFQTFLFRDTRHILAISFPIILALLLGRLLLMLFGKGSAAGYAFPAAMVGMLAVILVEARFALLLVVCASLLFGVAAGISSESNFSYLVVALASGFTGVASLFSLQKRSDVLIAGCKAGIVGFVSVLGVSALAGELEIWPAFAGLAGGLVSAALTYPCLFALERFAGITTDIGLMELTSLRHPLLVELEERAPGTYQHTLNMTKLAEAAAVAIGANYLLVRAGCYFHDIGKADKPKYFSENQVSPEDRRAHDKLNPHISALIIKEHVRRGVEKAEEHRLPARVIDFIREHHGTTTIAFFYHKALKHYEESDSSDPVQLEHFRYAGPPPQSRETAIALLADSVDAVAAAKLSGAVVTRDEIRRLVRDIVNQKFREEQFDQCDLTLRDLSLIQNAFARALEARYHHRVKYPEPAAKKRSGTVATSLKKRSVSNERPAPPRLAASGRAGAGDASTSGVGSSTGERPAVPPRFGGGEGASDRGNISDERPAVPASEGENGVREPKTKSKDRGGAQDSVAQEPAE
jgi:putative nucleotidyltransferase with HDIG domain